MIKQYILLFLSLSCIFANDVELHFSTYPDDIVIKIDSTQLECSNRKFDTTLSPGSYSITAFLKDTLVVAKTVTIYEEDSEEMINYKIHGEERTSGFRASIGGQWIFNNYESGPFYYESMYNDSTITTDEITYKKPFTFLTLDLGYITPKNYYFGAYGELFNVGGMFVFGKEWHLNKKFSLYAGGKIGLMDERRNSSYLKEIHRDSSKSSYIYHGWPVGDVQDSSGFVKELLYLNTYGRLGALDGQISYGANQVKLYLRATAWFGLKTDYGSFPTPTIDNWNMDDSSVLSIEYDYKYCVLPTLSVGIQIDVGNKSNSIGIHGPYGSNVAYYSSEKSIVTPLSSKGNRWFGGGIAFQQLSSFDTDHDSNLFFLFQTFARFYPRKNFILGPNLEWLHQEKDNSILVGIDVGYSININERIMPYAIFNPQTGIRIESGNKAQFNSGLILNAKLGALITFNRKVGMYIEPQLSLPTYEYLISYSVGMTYSFGKELFSLGSTLFPFKELSGLSEN